ncbi:Ync [Halorhodospira halochloris]|uniref:Ync n=2 Tax=Halorhodospira halochloris TaxID=1052 RepID=A0A120N043_HALHR|nr:hypothetical protein [Halorhodospira halochloris]BAU58733.1 Ync [Halorhodospira halochloris]
MTKTPVTLNELLLTRKKVVTDIQSRLGEDAKRFLVSLHDGAPDFDIIDRPQAANLPAVRWKILNIKKLMTENPEKHAEQLTQLEELLG